MVEHATRLSYDFKRQGSYSCELLTFEGGTWTASKIYQQNSRRIDGREVLSGYVESAPGRHFRVLLSFTRAGKRTQHWLIQEDLLCAIYVDGRSTPVSEHTIRKGTFENPVDATAPCTEEGVVFLKGLPFLNVPRELDQPFSWKARDPAYNALQKLPKGCECVDDLSSLRLVFSTCKVKRVKRGRAAFPPSEPLTEGNKEDRAFEPKKLKHEELSEYIHIASMESSDDGYDEIPDFEVDAEPFMEFRLYYKSARLLHDLGIKEPERTLFGEPPALRKERVDSPAKAPLSSMGRAVAGDVAYKPPTPVSQVKSAPIYQSRGPKPTTQRARTKTGTFTAAKASAKPTAAASSKTATERSTLPSASTISSAFKRKATAPESAMKKARPLPEQAHRRPPSPPPTPSPAPETARAASPAFSDASSLPSISRAFQRQPVEPIASTSRSHFRSDIAQNRQSTPGPVPRVKQEAESSNNLARKKGNFTGIDNIIDLTIDSDAEEELQKEAIARTIAAAEGVPANAGQALPAGPIAGTEAAGIPRLVRERQAASDLLEELGIHDDSNVQALLDTGFKNRDTFLNRLPRLDQEDRDTILAELRSEMGKVDYGIFCSFLKRSGVEL